MTMDPARLSAESQSFERPTVFEVHSVFAIVITTSENPGVTMWLSDLGRDVHRSRPANVD